MAAHRGIPQPPFGPDVGKGSITDIKLAKDALRGNSRFPIDAGLRARIIGWLEKVAAGEDPRAAVNACKALLQADTLNLREVELESKIDDDGNRKPGQLQVTVAGTVTHDHAMFTRIAGLTKSIGDGSGACPGDGVVAGDGVRELVDPRQCEVEDVSEAG